MSATWNPCRRPVDHWQPVDVGGTEQHAGPRDVAVVDGRRTSGGAPGRTAIRPRACEWRPTAQTPTAVGGNSIDEMSETVSAIFLLSAFNPSEGLECSRPHNPSTVPRYALTSGAMRRGSVSRRCCAVSSPRVERCASTPSRRSDAIERVGHGSGTGTSSSPFSWSPGISMPLKPSKTSQRSRFTDAAFRHHIAFGPSLAQRQSGSRPPGAIGFKDERHRYND